MNHQLDIFQAHRIGPVYHNTTAKTGEDLEKAQVKASGQTEAILKLFQDHPHTSFTPWDVFYHFQSGGSGYLIGSVRRSITTLTDGGYLVKTTERRKSGPANETSFCWRLKLNR